VKLLVTLGAFAAIRFRQTTENRWKAGLARAGINPNESIFDGWLRRTDATQ
jgi:hypothetical protein